MFKWFAYNTHGTEVPKFTKHLNIIDLGIEQYQDFKIPSNCFTILSFSGRIAASMNTSFSAPSMEHFQYDINNYYIIKFCSSFFWPLGHGDILLTLQGFLYGVCYYIDKEYFLVFPSIQVS